ncbi:MULTISPECIES: LysR family transcriptional regulator [unclassified Streptomyces]|uniref:helix-turn-helix domain-containing protein n=1 Tax=unclassified Streptomyces TaxID=2593676 RepID=UPI003650D15D
MQVIEEGSAAFGVYADYPQDARTALADIKSVAARIISRATRQHLVKILPHDLLEFYEEGLAQSPGRDSHTPDLRREGSMAPTQATTVAASLTAATQILLQSNVRAAGEALRWLIQIPSAATRAPALAPTVIISDWGRGISEVLRGVLFSALEPTMASTSRLRYRTVSPLPATPAPASLSIERSARIPAMFWASWALRMLPQKGVYLQTLRTALPCIVLQVGSNLTHDRAMKLLGEVTDSTNSPRILQQLQDGPNWRDIQAALIRLAEFLDGNPPPIDYRRRRLLDYSQLLPEQEWDEFCRRSVASTGRGPRHRLTRCYLFERISGIPAELAPEPFAANTSSWRSQLRNFPETLTPGFAAELERVGMEFLDRHGIREPIEWQPPIELLDGLTLPGFDPSRVEATVVHELMRREKLTLKQVAARLSTSTHAICHVLEQEPAPQSRWQARTAGAAREDLKRRLPPSELAHHYERYSESEIARKFNTSGALIRRIAREYGLPRRPPGSVRKCPPLAGEWLREQFVIQERRFAEPDSGPNMSLSMRNGRQSRGGRSGEDKPGTKSLADGAPDVLKSALTGIYGWERLARFAAAVPYGSLSEAAKNLGICRSVISMQIRQLERSLGGPLYVRTQRNRPMQLTPLGIEVLDAIQNIGLGRTEL